MNCLQACRTLPWPDRSADFTPIEHVTDMMRRRLYLPGNVDDLVRHLEQIWQEIPHENIWTLYISILQRVSTCIWGRGGSKSYGVCYFLIM